MSATSPKMSAAAPVTASDDNPKGSKPIGDADAPNGDPNRPYTARNVAYLTGLSVRTVYLHADEWGGVHITPRCVVFPRDRIDALIAGEAA
jgi:hypothetical protein